MPVGDFAGRRAPDHPPRQPAAEHRAGGHRAPRRPGAAAGPLPSVYKQRARPRHLLRHQLRLGSAPGHGLGTAARARRPCRGLRGCRDTAAPLTRLPGTARAHFSPEVGGCPQGSLNGILCDLNIYKKGI